MDEEELGGNDSSDEDYRPEHQELPSEEESDGEPEDDGNVSDEDVATERSSEVSDESAVVTVAVSEEDSKKKTDSLWADFLKDTTTVDKETTSSSKSTAIVTEPSDGASFNSSSTTGDNSKPVIVYEFAGEQVTVPAAAARGLSSILNQLGKKQKISTLEKSKLDWDRFKQDENIVDELSAHNKGRHGYLERQDFLQRADQRQFELEKELRTKHRSHRL
ncbi:yeti [Carabus blaptoides fortunei]